MMLHRDPRRRGPTYRNNTSIDKQQIILLKTIEYCNNSLQRSRAFATYKALFQDWGGNRLIPYYLNCGDKWQLIVWHHNCQLTCFCQQPGITMIPIGPVCHVTFWFRKMECSQHSLIGILKWQKECILFVIQNQINKENDLYHRF